MLVHALISLDTIRCLGREKVIDYFRFCPHIHVGLINNTTGIINIISEVLFPGK